MVGWVLEIGILGFFYHLVSHIHTVYRAAWFYDQYSLYTELLHCGEKANCVNGKNKFNFQQKRERTVFKIENYTNDKLNL